VATLTPFSVDGMIVAASTTLLADSRSGGGGGSLPWALLIVGSVASLAANVAVAEPTTTGRVIAAWPSFALIAAYELLMRQVRRSATDRAGRRERLSEPEPVGGSAREPERAGGLGGVGKDLQRQAWQWAQANRAGDGSLPSGRQIARQYDRHERWGRLVKRSGCVGEFALSDAPDLRLVQPSAAVSTNR
jgi:hypothetical protein